MTEEEAKTKTCPIFKASNDNYLPHTCIGSTCMAWRWDNEWTSAEEQGVGGDLVLRLKRKRGEPKLGFCGLAGKP